MISSRFLPALSIALITPPSLIFSLTVLPLRRCNACERFGSFPPPHSDHGSFYSDCHDSPGLGTWPHSTVFHEVITIFVPQ